MSVLQQHIPDETLDKAMQLFWQKGYLSVSIGDIVHYTGLYRAVIYQHFGGKQGLYIAMLQRYVNQVAPTLLQPLTQFDHPLEGMKDFFCQFLSLNEWPMVSQHGCMLIAEASQLPFPSSQLSQIIDNFFEHLHEQFANAIQCAQQNNIGSKQYSPQQTASFLMGNTIGVFTSLRLKIKQRWLNHHIMQICQFIDQLSQESLHDR